MSPWSIPPVNRHFTDFQEAIDAAWVRASFASLQQQAEGLSRTAPVEEFLAVVEAFNELSCHIKTHLTRVQLAFSRDTGDEQAAAGLRAANHEIYPAYREGMTRFLGTITSPQLRGHVAARYGVEFLRRADAVVATNSQAANELQVQLSDLMMRYTELFAKGTFDWAGETLPLSFYTKSACDPDRERRHAAFASYTGFVEANAAEIDAIYDESIRLRNEMAKALGFDSYVTMRYREMWRFGYVPAHVAEFRGAIRDYIVPLAERVHRSIARSLYGPDGPELLHPADLDVDPGHAPGLTVDIDGQLGAAARVFEELEPELAEAFHRMVDDGRIDLPARPGKATGAFCTELADQRTPYVFCNSVNSPDDVTTLVHELGHAFAVALSTHIDQLLLRNPTLEACEIHSMSLELLTHPWMDEFFGADAATYRTRHVEHTLLIVPYMAAIDEFQHEVYRTDRPAPDAAERGEIWARLMETYLPGIDHDAAPWWKRYRWLRQGHVFRSPFYYIDYAIARVCSWQLWLDSLEDPADALERYLAVCRVGGTTPLRELCSVGRLGVPFDPQVVAATAARLEPQLGL